MSPRPSLPALSGRPKRSSGRSTTTRYGSARVNTAISIFAVRSMMKRVRFWSPMMRASIIRGAVGRASSADAGSGSGAAAGSTANAGAPPTPPASTADESSSPAIAEILIFPRKRRSGPRLAPMSLIEDEGPGVNPLFRGKRFAPCRTPTGIRRRSAGKPSDPPLPAFSLRLAKTRARSYNKLTEFIFRPRSSRSSGCDN